MSGNLKNSWLNGRGQLILLLAGVSGLLFLMFTLNHLFNPLAYGLIVGIILYPIRQEPVARALLYATAFATGLWLIHDSGHLLIPFVLAFIIAFLINPLVEKLDHRNIPRWLSATLFTVVSICIMVLILNFAVPVIIQQLSKIGAFITEAANDSSILIEQTGLIEFLETIGMQGGLVEQQIINQADSFFGTFYQNITDFSSGYFEDIGNYITVGFFILLLPFLCFFMIRDYEKISSFLSYLVTPQGVETDYAKQISGVIGGYLRGQFIVVVISMVNLSLGFYLFGVPYALLLGILSGLTNFIPTFGLWLSISFTSLVAITLGTPWYQFLPGIYIVFAIEQVLETGFIVPRVVGNHVGVHPLLIMLSLLLFGFMFGLLGLIIAVPSVALLSILFEQYKETRKISFLEGSELDSFLEQFERNKEQPTSSTEVKSAR